MTDLRPWPVRLAWLVLPFAAGAALAGDLDPRSADLRSVAAVLLWVGWTVGLVLTLVPRTVTLTGIRTLAPVALAVTIWAALTGHPTASDVAAVSSAVIAVAAAFSPLTGDVFIDGSSYGNERRFALAVPIPLLLGPIPLSWAAAVAGSVTGPLLLGAHQWVAGAMAIAVGFPVAVGAERSLHQLARRWVVFVPNGMVLHDPIDQPEPTLFLRRSIRRLAAAAADTEALDLTAGAAGLALQLDLAEPATMLVRRARRTTETLDVTAVLFTPTRPAALLEEAAGRRLLGAGTPPTP